MQSLGRERILVTRDVSAGGVFVSTTSPFPSGLEVALLFHLKPTDSPISCRGRVVYALEGLGMGIVFVDLNEESRCRVQKFVDEAS